jgi:hypothetical protein
MSTLGYYFDGSFMTEKDSNKPRIREITEGTLASIISALVLAFLGIGGVATIGWLPTFLLLVFLGGGFYFWYRNDTSLQRLVNQRLFKIRHAVTSESVVLPRWNLIVEEVLPQIFKHINLPRQYLQMEHRHTTTFNSREYLILVIKYQTDDTKWLAIIDKNGNVINLHGGYKAVVSECNKCSSPILVKYWLVTNQKPVSENQTTCELCKEKTHVTVITPDEKTDLNSGVVLKNKKINTSLKDGFVRANIEFTVENFGPSAKICPHLELKVALLKNGKYVDSLEKVDLKPIPIDGMKKQSIQYSWSFPLGTIILSDKPNGFKVEIKTC